MSGGEVQVSTYTGAHRGSLLAYVPGSTVFTVPVHEQRTATYRTWHSPHADMSYGAECLLCGEWQSGYTTREGAEFWADRVHGNYCHVTRGCHCRQPHLTAAMAARIGVKDSYPQNRARELFRMAGGTRRYLPQSADLKGVLFGPLPDELGDVRVCLGHNA
jgi:hypothetical protein